MRITNLYALETGQSVTNRFFLSESKLFFQYQRALFLKAFVLSFEVFSKILQSIKKTNGIQLHGGKLFRYNIFRW